MFGSFTPGPAEMLVILALGVLLFGKRLPDVGKQLGRGILEFKRGLDEMGKGSKSTELQSVTEKKKEFEELEREELDVPKFDPPSVV